MKTTKQIIKEIEVVDDVICNKCGSSCKTDFGMEDFNSFEGIIELEIRGGYASKYLGDGNRYIFSICEKCLVDMFETFKIKPDNDEYILGE